MSDDDRWSDVIHQVLDALDDANVSDPHTRDALADGVRQALEGMEMGMGINIEISGSGDIHLQEPGPEVEVVDGGRNPDQPPTEGKKPSLRIATPDDESEPGNGGTESAPDSAPYVTQVKVLQGHPFGSPTSTPLMVDHGWISLPSGGAADAAWQTVYQGLRPRLYRLACLPGARIDVTVDGVQVERLNPGQSIDVEGMAIRVTNPDTETATGTYMPIQSEWNEE